MATNNHRDGGRSPSVREYREADGFSFLQHPNSSLLSGLIQTRGPRPAPPTPVPSEVLAHKRLESIFKSLCRHTHCHHEDDIFKHVNEDAKLGISNCRDLKRLYVVARRRYLDENHVANSLRTRLAQRVDQWIKIVD